MKLVLNTLTLILGVAGIVLGSLALSMTGCRAPDSISPRIAYHEGDDGGSAQSIGLAAEWDMGSRRANREAALSRLDALAHQQTPYRERTENVQPVHPDTPAVQSDTTEEADLFGLQEGLIGGGGLTITALLWYFRHAIILFFRKKGSE